MVTMSRWAPGRWLASFKEHIKPLADEVLFGKLKGGGHVRVVVVKDEASSDAGQDKIGFEYVEGPVTPKPEKLPGARKRPRKAKPSGRAAAPRSATGAAGQECERDLIC